jgi:gamma-glutamylcyclotransferase (GGCT)/AIG2-like uncharacterized protein YtfP
MKIFVYGSLLSGLHNHRVIANSHPLGEARTERRFRMHSLGGFPAVVAGGKQSILGEVYEVDAGTLERLDRLEGHPPVLPSNTNPLDERARCGDVSAQSVTGCRLSRSRLGRLAGPPKGPRP